MRWPTLSSTSVSAHLQAYDTKLRPDRPCRRWGPRRHPTPPVGRRAPAGKPVGGVPELSEGCGRACAESADFGGVAVGSARRRWWGRSRTWRGCGGVSLGAHRPGGFRDVHRDHVQHETPARMSCLFRLQRRSAYHEKARTAILRPRRMPAAHALTNPLAQFHR